MAAKGDNPATDIVLYSDGGGEKGSSAAAACIIENSATGARLHLLIFLGGATNNEAEITGGLLGFSFLHLFSSHEGKSLSVRWVCDSEYVLKSATAYIHGWQKNGWKTADKKPVKNQGLWRTFLKLSAGIRITPQHVRGHTGHEENEACDQASTWGRMNGAELSGAQGVAVHIDTSGEEETWYAFDGQEFLSSLRPIEGSEPEAEDAFLLTNILAAAKISSFDDLPRGGASGATFSRDKGFDRVIAKLKDAHAAAALYGEKHEKSAELAAALQRLIKKHAEG